MWEYVLYEQAPLNNYTFRVRKTLVPHTKCKTYASKSGINWPQLGRSNRVLQLELELCTTTLMLCKLCQISILCSSFIRLYKES